MDLDTSVQNMLAVQRELRSKEGIVNVALMSKNMMRLSQYTGTVEEHLAEYERAYEVELGKKMIDYMLVQEIKPTPAEARAKMELAETKGQILYLSRLVNSAWKQIGVIQSRINHLVRENTGQI